MNSIHDEKEIVQVNDKELMKKLLLFAKPYWKTLVISFIVAVVIVLTNLLQPILIKIAIDDRLNGIFKPMLVYEGQEPLSKTDLENQGWSVGEVIEVGEQTYIRIYNAANQQGSLEGLEVEKVQIVQVDDNRVMIDGWLSTEQEEQIRLIGIDTDSPLLIAGNQSYSAEILDEKQLQVFREGDFTGLLWLGALFLLIVIVGACLNFTQMNMMQNAGQKIIYDIRQRMFEHLAKLQISFFDKNPAGRIVTRVAHDVEALNNLYSQVIVNLVKEVCMLFGIVGFMLLLSVELTLISFIIIPVLVAVTFIIVI